MTCSLSRQPYCDDEDARVFDSDEPSEGAAQGKDADLIPLLANQDRSQRERASEALYRHGKPSRLDLDDAGGSSGATLGAPVLALPHQAAGTVRAGHGGLPDRAGLRASDSQQSMLVQGHQSAPGSRAALAHLVPHSAVSDFDCQGSSGSWGGGGDGWERWWRSDMAVNAEVCLAPCACVHA